MSRSHEVENETTKADILKCKYNGSNDNNITYNTCDCVLNAFISKEDVKYFI